jgi:hypothetical protein
MITKERDRVKAEVSFKNIVVPFLRTHGWTDQQIESMIPRVEFCEDYKNWSIRLEDSKINDIPVIERTIRYEPNSNRLILQAFINMDKVVSYGVIPASVLSKVINEKTHCYDKINSFEGVWFRCFKFSKAKKLFGNLCYVFNA